MGAEDIGIGSLGIYSGLSFPQAKNTSQNLAGSGWEVFFINFEKWQVMASHGNIFIIFIAKNGMIFHDLSM